MSERIAKLKEAIETMYRCKAVHVASEAVVELSQAQVAWEGVVETFNLWRHPRARRCHAWSYQENGETRYVTVLELPPVDSAASAVRAAIAAGANAKQTS